MSLQFYDSTNKSGIVDLIYSNTGADTTKYPLVEVTRDVNLALDKAFSIIFRSDGRWQFDDSNHTDYPILTTNLVSGQRDYSFTTDESGNLILDIYKVMVKGSDGIFREITPVDQQDRTAPTTMVNGVNSTGTPTTYDKTANGIFLDLIPSYSSTGGLKIMINREASYFASTDTTKKPGFAGIFHEYLALRPSYQFGYRKGLQNTQALREEMLLMEQELAKYYGNREKDTKKRMVANVEDNK
jgi:hypothetical protein